MKTADRKFGILNKRQKEKYLRLDYARKQRKWMSIMMAIVVLITTVGCLKLPAITLSVTDGDRVQFELGIDTLHQALQAEGNGYHVSLEYTEEARIPEGAGLSVREIAPDSDEYRQYLINSYQFSLISSCH